MTDTRRLYSNSVVYALGGILSRAIGFVMIPIYTRCLTPADYGTVELLYRAADVVSLIAALGLGQAVVRFYFDYHQQRDRDEVVSTGLALAVTLSLALALLVSVFRQECSFALFGHYRYTLLVELAAASMLLDLIVIVPLSHIQSEQQSFLYTIISMSRLAVGLTLNIVLIVYARMGVLGVAVSSVSSSVLAVLITVPMVVRRTGYRFSIDKARELLRYGMPLVPSQLCMFVLTFGDRFIVNHYMGPAEVGIYSLGYKFGMLLNIVITQPFVTAWVPYALSIIDTDSYKAAYSSVLANLASVVVAFALITSLFARDTIRLVSAPGFLRAYAVIPPVCLGYAFLALSYELEIGMIVKKRVSWKIFTVGTSAITNLVLNILLVPSYGAMGAAWATAIAFAYLSVITYVVCDRMLPIPYHVTRIAAMIIIGVALYGLGAMIRTSSIPVSIAVNAAVFACFPLALVKSGIWHMSEARKLVCLLQSRTIGRPK